MVPPCSLRVPRAHRYSGYRSLSSRFVYRTVTVSGPTFKKCSTTIKHAYTCPYPYSISTISLASSNFARHYFRNLVWFLFLRLLRCFSSAGSLPVPMNSVQDLRFFTVGVSPFGNPRVKAYFQLTVAYRRLSRPSSALGAKAFTLCSFSLEQLLLLLFSQDLLLAWASQIIVWVVDSKKTVLFWIPLFPPEPLRTQMAKLFLPLILGKTF